MKMTTCSISRREPAVTGELPSSTAKTVPRSNTMVIDGEVTVRGEGKKESEVKKFGMKKLGK
jgi:hypothetical protein